MSTHWTIRGCLLLGQTTKGWSQGGIESEIKPLASTSPSEQGLHSSPTKPTADNKNLIVNRPPECSNELRKIYQLINAHIGVDTVGKSNWSWSTTKFFHSYAVVQITKAKSTIFHYKRWGKLREDELFPMVYSALALRRTISKTPTIERPNCMNIQTFAIMKLKTPNHTSSSSCFC